jgi:aminoglycoside 6'-N-acetyltransferase I
MSFTIRRATHADKPEWLRMRHGLWPEAPMDYLALDLDDRLADEDTAVFVTLNADGQLVAFIEVDLRDYAEGCETSPVGYIEAWYVDSQARGQSLGRDLILAAERWARPARRQKQHRRGRRGSGAIQSGTGRQLAPVCNQADRLRALRRYRVLSRQCR